MPVPVYISSHIVCSFHLAVVLVSFVDSSMTVAGTDWEKLIELSIFGILLTKSIIFTIYVKYVL